MKNDPGMLPQRIGKYDVVEMLGRGGMGIVYRARDTRIGRDVAIKTLTAGYSGDPEMLKRFYQEAGNTGNLRHPNIVTVYDFGDEDGHPYIVMEYLEGVPLDRLMRENPELHMSQKLEIIEQVCSALAYAHGQGMIHRDVKPANIIVQPDGAAKLLDFGIARNGPPPSLEPTAQTDSGLTRAGAIIGTPAYMAPERLRGERFDGRSDIFSVGIVLYQLLTGSPPFEGEYPANLHQILHDDPVPLGRHLASYPPQLDEILQLSLAKDPLQRYSSAGEMGADLRAVGRKLKSQRVMQMVGEARTALKKEEYASARSILHRILRVDPQHASARKLMTQVEQCLSQQKLRQQMEQTKRLAQEAIEARRWDEARSLCAEMLKLDAQDGEALSLLQAAEKGQQNRDEMQQFLRQADSARRSGDYDAARRMAGRAADLDPSDSRIQAICRILEQEALEARRKAELRGLLETVHREIAAGHLTNASGILAEAEKLSSSDAELIRLKGELSDQLRKEERKRVLENLTNQAEISVTLEQLQSATAAVAAALEKYPAEPSLLRLKLQLEPRLRDQENRRLVAEVSEACAALPPAQAMEHLRQALLRLPGNPELLALESAISQRLTREQREQMLAEYLAKARGLLEDHLYLETAKVLEACQSNGFASPEITDLLEMARSAAAKRVSQDLVERSFLEAKELLREEEYEAVTRLLPPVLQRVEEPALRRLLEEATRKQEAIEKRAEQVMFSVERLSRLEMFDAVIGLISAEPAAVRRTQRVTAALESSRKLLESESATCTAIGAVYALLDHPECVMAFQKAADNRNPKPSAVADLERRLAGRVHASIDWQIGDKIEAARQALRSDQPELAHDLLEAAAAWQGNATAEVQAEFRATQLEVAAARKVLRFRRVR